MAPNSPINLRKYLYHLCLLEPRIRFQTLFSLVDENPCVYLKILRINIFILKSLLLSLRRMDDVTGFLVIVFISTGEVPRRDW